MRIKRLEIHGFKSFKDKTVIHFDHSITGIVGPNGCGKSNIVDAFFWVMGEQSYKNMRGSQSADLIFNGSAKYSALGRAEATLVLEIVDPLAQLGEEAAEFDPPSGATVADQPLPPKRNAPYREISVTRRLYRSGEGEYLINGSAVRLRDVQELFLDTGVGAKGYSVIEQGQIGKIVNAKPEERRLLIEDAAGVAKYKARKRESLRKMEAAEVNLARLQDILGELQKTLASLERQASKARQYQQLKEELTRRELRWGQGLCAEFRERSSQLEHARQTLDLELQSARNQRSAVESSVEAVRLGVLTTTQDMELLQRKISEELETLAQAKSALELSRRRQADCHERRERLAAEAHENQLWQAREQERQAAQEIQSQEWSQEEAAAQALCVTLFEELQRAKTQLDAQRMQIQERRREVLRQANDAAHYRTQVETQIQTADFLRNRQERLVRQQDAIQERFAESELTLQNARQSLEEIEIARDAVQNDLQVAQASLSHIGQLLQAAEGELRELTQGLTLSQSRYQSLNELDENLEGLEDATQAALEWTRSARPDLRMGLIAQEFEVPPELEGALAQWLGPQLEGLMMDRMTHVGEIFAHLRTHQLGRLNLQIVPSESPPPATPESADLRQALSDAGLEILGRLDELVRCTPAVAHLVSRVFVVRQIPPEFLVNCEINLGDWSMVSLEAVVLSQGAPGIWRCVGGSARVSGALGMSRRRRALNELRSTLETQTQQVEQRSLQCHELRQERDRGQSHFEDRRAQLQAQALAYAVQEGELRQTQRAREELMRELERCQGELEDAQAELEDAQRLAIELELRAADFVGPEEGQAQLAQLEQALGEKQAIYEVLSQDHQTARLQAGSLEYRRQNLVQERANFDQRLISQQTRRDEIHRLEQSVCTELQVLLGTEAESFSQIEDRTQRLTRVQAEYSQCKDELEQLNASIQGELDQIRALTRLGEERATRLGETTRELEKLSAEMSHTINNLEEKYGLGCLQRDIPAETTDEFGQSSDPIALSRHLETLRERMRRLGEVNVLAIEEFESLQQRSDHLQKEKADLERSLTHLKNAIDHINQTSKERFERAFQAIGDRFARLFPIVFGGGQAHLKLVYAEGSTDILEAGVDIFAQPPGKKVSNISLLSGGEKALTAVSLIFAIFMVKPSPFCVLDEVDAPLDDANIGRFNALLREMSQQSQFILITHNKKTMELNDSLYGVTMEEPGVSKMVSIELRA